MGYDSMVRGLSAFRLPSLQALYLKVNSSNVQTDDVCSHSLLLFLNRSKCQLRELGLDINTGEPCDDFFRNLRHEAVYSSLEELCCSLSNLVGWVDFLSDTSNLPRLRKLTMTSMTFDEADEMTSAADMIEGRREGGDCLQLEYFKLSAHPDSKLDSDGDEKVQSAVARIRGLAQSSRRKKTPFVANIEMTPTKISHSAFISALPAC
jgi:hypothetical protein